MKKSPGKRFKEALEKENPLQIVGAINALCAIFAKKAGFQAIYLSGAGVANHCFGLPDIGITTLDNVLDDAKKIVDATDLPLLVDIDTGWGSDQMIARSVKLLERIGVAAIHIEDQVFEKKCGHLEGKKIISIDDMCARIRACVKAKEDPDFVIMARTDAFAVEGLKSLIKRAKAYKEAGADMLFAEALPSLDLYKQIKKQVSLPLLANLTEFGKTPLYSLDELKTTGVDMVLYPLSAARAMNLAAVRVYDEIRKTGSQKACLKSMLTRDELYYFLNYKG